MTAGFEERAGRLLESVPARLQAAGLPPEILPQAMQGCTLAVSGVRTAFERFTVRPPLEGEQEAEALRALVDEMLEREVAGVIAEFIKWRDDVFGRTQKRLLDWQRARPVLSDKPTPAQCALLTDREPADTGHFEWHTNDDGTRTPVYTLRPEKGDR